MHLGLLHLLLQLEAGTPGISNETVRYGLYKGKPSKPLPRHLTRSFRPVDVESGVSGTASGIATARLAADLELTSTYTPTSFRPRGAACGEAVPGPCAWATGGQGAGGAGRVQGPEWHRGCPGASGLTESPTHWGQWACRGPVRCAGRAGASTRARGWRA